VLLSYIDRFGVEAVYGRTPGAGELRRMVVAENVIKAFEARQQAQDWAQWSKDNPELAALLAQAMRLTNGE